MDAAQVMKQTTINYMIRDPMLKILKKKKTTADVT
jgi:hypothetical protein